MDIGILNDYLKEADKNKKGKDEEFWPIIWNEYINQKLEEFDNLSTKEALHRIMSELNYKLRSSSMSCEDLGVRIKVGNICFVDYGVSYINEAGYQHFGLVMSITNGKALVVPMTSNAHTYKQSQYKEHLMTIGKIEGMNKESVLFLNDARFINTARIIDVKAYIPKNSELFNDIQKKLWNCIIGNNLRHNIYPR